MKKLRKIIKDIVRQQAEYANRMNSVPQPQRVRNVSRKQMIITDDGVGRR
jgi:hypothetical protein